MQNIYITWHYTTHGIAYLKHILSAFYGGLCSVSEKRIQYDNISQDEMNEIFNSPEKQGFVFDKVYYLTTPQASFDNISSRRFDQRKNIWDDQKMIENNLLEVWKDVVSQNWVGEEDCIDRELQYVREKYPEQYAKFEELIWRDMQHYSIKSQIKWLTQISNAKDIYAQKFEEKQFDVADLRNSQEIANKIYKWVLQLPRKHPNAKFVINVALGSNETQVVWHILAEAGLLPPDTKLIFTYDNKADRSDAHFKRFRIQEVSNNLISSIQKTFSVYADAQSVQRRIAELKLQNYLEQGFAILMLGERGTGKTHLIEKHKKDNVFVDANCASFEDDSKAEAELFGYEKGAFTGADKRTEGLFHAARGGILFLDEFHHLSKRVQAKLMKATQTDENNNFNIRQLGATKSEKIKCKIIMASNKTIAELRQILLPDFYDRISQMIIELPPLRNTPEDRLSDWKAIWRQMKLDKHPMSRTKEVPNDKDLMSWLSKLELNGNYRDLQKIAIYYHTYLTFTAEIKRLIPQKSAFEFTKSEFERYQSAVGDVENISDLLSEHKTPNEMISLFKQRLAEWAINQFGSAPKAEAHFNRMGDNTKARTLYLWKNGK